MSKVARLPQSTLDGLVIHKVDDMLPELKLMPSKGKCKDVHLCSNNSVRCPSSQVCRNREGRKRGTKAKKVA